MDTSPLFTYESVEKLSGEKVTAAELLDFVCKTVSEYALTKILKDPQLGKIDEETRFYLLWRWTYNGAKVLFDDARKLAQAIGVEITEQWGNGFIKKDKEFISVLDAKDRGRKFLEKLTSPSSWTSNPHLTDVLHACLLCWEQNDRKTISEIQSPIPENTKVVVFVGTHADPIEGRTIWGEIAHQLACLSGKQGVYKKLKES